MSTFRALIWEQWRQTWKASSLTFCMLCAFLISQWQANDFSHNPMFDLKTAWTFAWTFALVGMLFQFLHESLDGLSFTSPRRMHILPVSTKELVVSQLFYKTGAALIFSLPLVIAAWIYSKSEGLHPVEKDLLWLPPAALVLLACWGQALVALIGGLGIWRAIALFIPLALGAFWAALLLAAQAQSWAGASAKDGWALPLALFLFALVAGVLIAYAGSKVARHRSPSEAIRLSDLRPLPEGYREFARSPLGTQVWYEWRNTFSQIPRWTGIILFTVILCAIAGAGMKEWGTLVLVYVAAPLLPGTLAFWVGYTSLHCKPSYLGFAGVRPLSSNQIAFAKLIAGALAVVSSVSLALVGAVLFFVFVALFTSWFGNVFAVDSIEGFGRQIIRGPGVAQVLGGILLGVWSSLFLGRVIALIWTGLAALCLPMLALYGDIPQEASAAFILIPCVLVVAFVGYVLWRRLIPERVLIVFLLFVLAGTISVFVLPESHRSLEDRAMPLLLIVAAFFPFVWVPFIIQRQRHR